VSQKTIAGSTEENHMRMQLATLLVRQGKKRGKGGIDLRDELRARASAGDLNAVRRPRELEVIHHVGSDRLANSGH
jgi:hypothetical protein